MTGRRTASPTRHAIVASAIGVAVAVGVAFCGLVAERSDAAGIAAAGIRQDGPTNSDHWHAAFGVYLCDRYLPAYDGSNDPDDSGIHTHDDGLIHIHPFTREATRTGATLGAFFRTHGYVLRTGLLVVPTATGTSRHRDGERCPDGRVGNARLVQFGGPKDAGGRLLKGRDGTPRLWQDQELALVFAPPGVKIPRPPSVRILHSPPDVDGGVFSPNTTLR